MASQTTIQQLTLTSNAIDLAKTQYASFKHLIPDLVNRKLSFELLDSNEAFANGLRRAFINEIPVRHLTVSMTDIFTTDPWIDASIIRGRIEMLPIPQDIPVGSTYSIRFENTSDTHVDIMSSELKQRGSAVKGMIQSVPICSINSMHSLTVDQITVAESYGYTNSRVSVGRVSYEILQFEIWNADTNKFEVSNDMRRHSAAEARPIHFRMEVEVPGNIDPKKMVLKAIDSICDRLDTIDYSLSKVEFDVYKLTITNESHTIGNLMALYINKLCPTVAYVAMREAHPSKRECTIDLKHSQAEQLCKQAVAAIKKEYAAIRSVFA